MSGVIAWCNLYMLIGECLAVCIGCGGDNFGLNLVLMDRYKVVMKFFVSSRSDRVCKYGEKIK